ncbi:C1 family peptidase [Thalassobellus sediminis]|uniref:C1 family peptidase n=1 Tax=Thalassobellus sediminis TaxID=3367753 RepID=UPI0037B4DCEC
MKHFLFNFSLLLTTLFTFSQETTSQIISGSTEQPYEFTTVIDLKTSAVKNQGKTQTCWSFSTSSFIESEIYKNSEQDIDISEMFNVRKTYEEKAWNYIMRQGKTQFNEGGLAHDVTNSIKKHGLVPETAYNGFMNNENRYDHSKIVSDLKVVLDAYIKNVKDSKYPNWKQSTDSILNLYIGKTPETFIYNDQNYTPKSFLEMTKFNPDDYVSLTSFTQVPFYSKFILNIPDNFSNGSYYNVPLNELVEITDYILKEGHTIALDIDISEKTFSQKYGVAVIPKDIENTKKSLTYIVKENDITQEYRQEEFENYNTTDDHLMHITGIVKDQNNKMYYKVKNSWGSTGNRIGNGGFIYISKSYFKLKTISILLKKDILPKKTYKILSKS